jgi:hypothetical protein
MGFSIFNMESGVARTDTMSSATVSVRGRGVGSAYWVVVVGLDACPCWESNCKYPAHWLSYPGSSTRPIIQCHIPQHGTLHGVNMDHVGITGICTTDERGSCQKQSIEWQGNSALDDGRESRLFVKIIIIPGAINAADIPTYGCKSNETIVTLNYSLRYEGRLTFLVHYRGSISAHAQRSEKHFLRNLKHYTGCFGSQSNHHLQNKFKMSADDKTVFPIV